MKEQRELSGGAEKVEEIAAGAPAAISSTFSAPPDSSLCSFMFPPQIANTCLPMVTTVWREKIHALVAVTGL